MSGRGILFPEFTSFPGNTAVRMRKVLVGPRDVRVCLLLSLLVYIFIPLLFSFFQNQ